VDSDHPTHSSYTIFSDDGRVLQRVQNLSGSFYADPATVRLSAGKYKVEARATNFGLSLTVVPVVIEEGKTTTVYLDGEAPPVDLPQTNDSDWVHLPGGQIVGHRAPASN